jgi:predicted membrane-bound spermidine synthase
MLNINAAMFTNLHIDKSVQIEQKLKENTATDKSTKFLTTQAVAKKRLVHINTSSLLSSAMLIHNINTELFAKMQWKLIT